MAVLRIVSPDQLSEQEALADEERVRAEDAANQNSKLTSSLVAFIDNEFATFSRHRDGASGWSDRLVNAMRVFTGIYDANKLQEIRRFGGSEIYARLIATKCRGATKRISGRTPNPNLKSDVVIVDQPVIERIRDTTNCNC